MYIERIILKNFRNLKNRSMGPFTKNINLIIGPNGSGKTNVLEALGLSAIAKSCRGAQSREMVAFGSDTAVVGAEGIFQKKKSI